mmetsp:Transcript_20845/g.73548  ORF Transcript_20845/g.73548 Transcript_20845/m.73548 type:complete len:144 (-) Transcript_20845:3315-3746(-)
MSYDDALEPVPSTTTRVTGGIHVGSADAIIRRSPRSGRPKAEPAVSDHHAGRDRARRAGRRKKQRWSNDLVAIVAPGFEVADLSSDDAALASEDVFGRRPRRSVFTRLAETENGALLKSFVGGAGSRELAQASLTRSVAATCC